MRDFLRRHESLLMVPAVGLGVFLFALGCATALMIFQHGASGALAIMGRNVPWMPYVAPAALLFAAWLFVDGLLKPRR